MTFASRFDIDLDAAGKLEVALVRGSVCPWLPFVLHAVVVEESLDGQFTDVADHKPIGGMEAGVVGCVGDRRAGHHFVVHLPGEFDIGRDHWIDVVALTERIRTKADIAATIIAKRFAIGACFAIRTVRFNLFCHLSFSHRDCVVVRSILFRVA